MSTTLWIAFGQFSPVEVAPVNVLEERPDRYRVVAGPHTYWRDWLWRDDPWLGPSKAEALTKAIAKNRADLTAASRKVDALVGALNNQEHELAATSEGAVQT